MLKLGTAKLTVSPQTPVRMVGYAIRTDPYTEITEDICTRVYSLRNGAHHVMLVYADLLWWNSEFVATARPRLSKALGMDWENILFTASHNHSGPGTGNNFTPLLETSDAGYCDYLCSRVEEAARLAISGEEDVQVTLHEESCRLNVYRRVMGDNGIVMLPNYSVPADDHLTVLRFTAADGGVRGILAHYPCHANLSNGNTLHPDYPGTALRMLDEEYPGCVSMFLQGCTADLRPNSVLGGEFVPQDHAGVLLFARQFYDRCRKALENSGTKLEDGLNLRRVCLTLPVDQSDLAQMAAGGDEATRQWKACCEQKNYRDHEILEISLLKLGALGIYFFNAEVSQHYAAYARSLQKYAISACYTDGMIGYLADAVQIGEGGYEPKGSAVYFAVAGTYPAAIQDIIENGMRELT